MGTRLQSAPPIKSSATYANLTEAFSFIDTGDNNGAVFVYRVDGTTSIDNILLYQTQFDQQFGSSIAIRGDRIAVGAPKDSYQYSGVISLSIAGRKNFFRPLKSKDMRFSGSVYTFRRMLGECECASS